MKNKSVIYLQYTNPAGYPPLEHSSRILADRGWQVTFVGCGASGEADQFQFPPHENVRIFKWKFPKPGWRQKLHFFLWTWWAVWITLWTGSRWIYSSETLSCPAAWLASFLPRRRVIYHEHDSPPDVSQSRFMESLLKYRKSVCDKASAAVLPNSERAKLFYNKVKPKCPLYVVWNVPEKREIINRATVSSGNYILFYHGSLNYLRLPISVLDALNLLPPKTELHFAGYTTSGSPTFIQDYLAEAQKRGLGERVVYLGAPKYRSDLLCLASNANLGLAFMPTQSNDINMVTMAGASNKPFDYLACGLNLLVSDLPDWRELFVIPKFGLACNPNDSKSIALGAKWFIDNPQECQIARKKGFKIILDEWNYDKQFEDIILLMES